MKKKLIALLAGCMIMASASMSMALGVDGWGFNLTSIGGGNYTKVDRLSVDGVSTIIQNLPLAVGSTFTESGNLGIISGYFEPGDFGTNINPFNTGGYNLYFHASGLAGQITSLLSPTAEMPTGGFTYSFTPGIGTISLVADANYIFSDGVFDTLATFSVSDPSNGTNVGMLGGLGPNGTTNLTGLFLSADANVFTWNGLDFNNLPSNYVAFGLTNTNNTIASLTPTGTDITLVVNSGGQFGVNVVPEPGTFALLGAGLFGLVIAAKRRSKN